MCALQNHVMVALQSTGKILRPSHLVKNLRFISGNFRNSRQEDAHEYMVNLLESMHKCCLPSGIASESPSAYEKSLVHKIFGGRLRSQVKCLQCSYCSNKFDPFLDLSLEIVKADTLHKALSHFTAVEQLDGGEKQYQCQQCKQKVRAVKQLTIHKAPYVLTVHLKRFDSALPGEKIKKKVEFEPTLDLKRYVSSSCDEDLKYTLYGVLVHAGSETHSGHYYCFVRTSSGTWYSLNDHQVFQVSEKTVLQQKAYMLFYVRNVRSSAPKRALGAVCKENRPANASGNKKLPVYCLDSKKAVQDCPRESRAKQSDAISKTNTCPLGVSMPLKDISSEKSLLKKTSLSSDLLSKDAHKPVLSEDYYIVCSSSKIYSMKEPSPTVCPLSSARGKHSVAESLVDKASSGDNSNNLSGKDLVQSAQSKDVSVCAIPSGTVRSASTSEVLIAVCSPVEDCSITRSRAPNSLMKDDVPTDSTVCVDKSNMCVMCPSKCKAMLNPSVEKIGAVHEKHDAQNIKERVDGTKRKPHSFLDHGRATLCNRSSAVDGPEGLRIAHVQCQGAIVSEGGSNDMVAAKVLESISKESEQCDLSNNKLSISCCSSQEAAGRTEFHKIVRKQKISKHSHVRNFKFGSRRLFLSYLIPVKRNVKKKKHQRNKKMCLNAEDDQIFGTLEGNIQGVQGASKTVMVTAIDVDGVHSTKKRSCNSLRRESGTATDVDKVHSKRKRLHHSLGRVNVLHGLGDVNILKDGSVNAKDSDGGRRCVMNSAETSLSLEGDQQSAREACTSSNSAYHVSRNLLRGLGEVAVARWGDRDSLAEVASLIDDKPTNIGYMLHEWAKEYDRGKKKVKRSRRLSGGKKHFRDFTAAGTQKMRMDQASSGNKPFRICG
uniref:Ubiquitin carboxyl-terminal hydrolase 23 n=1 Tax=Anthurium amnicola TaxID=1678845 RepID=A0A1D1Z2Z0_9ARAE